MSVVRMENDGPVAVILIDNPPVNALSPGVGEGVLDAVARAEANAAVSAIVLMGAGRSFIAGADIRHFGKGMVRPPVGQRVSDRLDQGAKPIVAAIHGYALGGGLEYALACHYRIAAADACVGLPEVLIGAIPGGGGTQRLPRLIGPRAALEMIVSGRHVPAPEAHALGVLDALVDRAGDLRTAAVAFAARIAGTRPLPRVRDREERLREACADPGIFDAMRRTIARTARNQIAPQHCIAAVEAACRLPFTDGLHEERRLFEELEGGSQARALRYAFFAEREAAKLPDVPAGLASPAVAAVGIVGAGTMGAGIATACADAGLQVRLLDSIPGAVERALQRIAAGYRTGVERGRLGAAEAAARIARIAAVRDYTALADCDVAIEAVFEDLEVKRHVLVALQRALRPDALLLTNTSALDIDLVAEGLERPAAFAGAHFFSPAQVMKLLEVVVGNSTSAAALSATTRFGRRLNKTCVVVRNADGFLTSRSRSPLTSEMIILLEEGALPEQVDRAMVDFGYPMGPFAVSDLAGLDIARAVRARRAAADPGFRRLPIADTLVEMGRLGQKTGAGWYRYETGSRTPHPDPAVARVIDTYIAAQGGKRRAIGDEEILHRLLFGAVNEACRIVDEGLVYRASDIDVAWLHGFGFPRHRGGLLFWADEIGGARIAAQLAAWQQTLGPRWTPARLLVEAAASGSSLRTLAATVRPLAA